MLDLPACLDGHNVSAAVGIPQGAWIRSEVAMTRPTALRILIPAIVSILAPGVAGAQTLDTVSPQTYDPPAHVSYVEGRATLEREGALDDEPRNMPLVAGDRLRTRDGRVEVLFADGSTLHLDANTAVDFQSDELIRLLEGRVRLSIPGPDPGDVFYRVDAAAGWAQITAPGEYRLSLRGDPRSPELELAVIRGQAALLTDGGQTPLSAGERAFVRAGAAPSYAYVFNSASWDAFDAWSESRRSERAALSVQYLPGEVRRYAPEFDHHGDWRHHHEHGYVWYPRVAVDWRPYYQGRWVTMPLYGWTWIGRDPWAWPTHHYGRWGFSAGAWFWIPGRSWAPAWVAWAYAPGYVSWGPLGWNNRPLVQINIFTGRDRWHPWTVVPYRYFGRGYVHARAVHYWNIDANVRRSFAHRPTPPEYTVRPRGAPIRVAGRSVGTAVPRGSRTDGAPLYTNRDTDGRRVTGQPAAGASRAIPQAGSRPSPERARPSEPATRSMDRPSVVPRTGAPAASDRGRPSAEPNRSPAPSRATPPAGSRPSPERARPSTPATGSSSPSRVVPRGGAPAPSERQAMPQARPNPAGSRARTPAAPSPSAAPEQRRSESPAPADAPSRQAAPRYSRPSDVGPAPNRSGGVARERTPAASPAPSHGAPSSARPAPAPQRGPGVQRSAPSPSRAPAPAARPSSGGSSGGGESRPGSRPRGGGQSSGSARPRGGGQ
jgi:hypothetical protein